ncbi:hypothetical protein AVEN_123272-1 [Araneus ventricosus]|uniref:Transposase Tc1-like domain-containing protein n=1 Tax=Araneus ventricosus TaxID=182803 RepID=A0A4Y2IRX8_ARAVE|nr:hypothetical protein AVEN_123272-1 [Araneus ventricosus]
MLPDLCFSSQAAIVPRNPRYPNRKALAEETICTDEMRWRAVGMLQAGERQSAVARGLNVHRSVNHRLWNNYQRDQNASRRLGSGRWRIATTADDCYLLTYQTLEDTNRSNTSWSRSSLLLKESPCPAKLCRADCIKEDCSHGDLLFVCLCLQRTSERGCIGPVNITVGHQSSGATYSLRMSLDLTSRTIPEGQ